MSWRFGRDDVGWLDLPAGMDVSVDYQVIGGNMRGVSGRDNRDRHALKRVWSIPLKPYMAQVDWLRLRKMFRTSPGPYFLQDSSNPNFLPDSDAVGSGWQTSAGGLIPTAVNMRVPVNATYTSAQTAKTTTPVLADLIPVSTATLYSAALNFNALTAFVGSFSVWGYNGATGSGTQLNTVALTTSGRYWITFASSTYTHIAFRVARTSGTGEVYDANLVPGADDPGQSIVPVFIDSLPHTVHRSTDKQSTLSIILSEV